MMASKATLGIELKSYYCYEVLCIPSSQKHCDLPNLQQQLRGSGEVSQHYEEQEHAQSRRHRSSSLHTCILKKFGGSISAVSTAFVIIIHQEDAFCNQECQSHLHVAKTAVAQLQFM